MIGSSHSVQLSPNFLSNPQNRQTSSSLKPNSDTKDNGHLESSNNQQPNRVPITHNDICGGLQRGSIPVVNENTKPINEFDKFKLVIIHCFSASKNTFTYSFKNGTVPQNSKSIKDYVEVAEYLSIFICRKTYQELINRNGKC